MKPVSGILSYLAIASGLGAGHIDNISTCASRSHQSIYSSINSTTFRPISLTHSALLKFVTPYVHRTSHPKRPPTFQETAWCSSCPSTTVLPQSTAEKYRTLLTCTTLTPPCQSCEPAKCSTTPKRATASNSVPGRRGTVGALMR